jgi:hypothetical protein
MLIKISHDFDATADAFFALFFDREAMLRMYRDYMTFPECTITQRDDGERLHRTIVAIPKMELPGAVAKIAGSTVRYTEEGTFDKKSKIFTWKTTPSFLSEKIKNDGVMRVETLGEGKIRRTAEITVEAKVFGVGGIIESTFEKTIREAWEQGTRFFREELPKRK